MRGLLNLFRPHPAPSAGPPSLPQGVRVYAVGDIHGQLHLLARLRALIEADLAAHPAAEAVEVYLGDYIDRGADSAGVMEHLATLGAERQRVFLRGNHELYLEDALAEGALIGEWLTNGGVPTLASYGVSVAPAELSPRRVREALAPQLPAAHRAFLDHLVLWHRIGDVVFAHAGIRPGVPLDAQTPDDLLFIRGPFHKHAGPLPYRVVHGHTPVKEPVVTPWRIAVDTGAFATGRLTAAVLEGSGVRFLQTGG